MAYASSTSTGAPFVLPTAGQPGLTGQDAYQVWLAAGNSGDRATFLASLKGRDGADGAGTVLQLLAATDIGASINVVDNGNGTVSPADPSNPAHCGKLAGLVLLPTPAGSLASITLLGPITGVVGVFGDGQRLWIGPGGICTANPPTSGWRQLIGQSTTGGSIVYQPGDAEFYDPSSPLVLIPVDNNAALRAFMNAALNALPPLPTDTSQVPVGGQWYRDVDAVGERMVKLYPPQVSP
ncbi:hypothetical protein [Methylobacterium sp. Gmos1]